MWKSWGEQSKKQRGETEEGKVTSPPGGESGQRGGEMIKDIVSGGFLDIKVSGVEGRHASTPGKGYAFRCRQQRKYVRRASLLDLLVG